MKFKTEAGLEHSDITGFPTLNDMAICLWINIQDYPTSLGQQSVKILDYVNKGAAHPLFQIVVEVGTEVQLTFKIGEAG